MKARTVFRAKSAAAFILLIILGGWGCRDNKPLVYGTIHEAVEKGNLADVKAHLDRGADVNAKDEDGKTPLYLAVDLGRKDLAELLLVRGASVNAKDEDDSTPLHEAAISNLGDLTGLLIAKGADVKARDKDGQTPLHGASLFGYIEVMEMLIAKGADVNAENEYGVTPLFSAENNGHMDAAELLKKHGALDNPPGLPSGEPSSPHRITGEEEAPKIIKEVEPIYPEAAIQARVEGIVIIEATTDEQGKVIDTRILRSIPMLDEAALTAVKQWVYEPYITAGAPRGVIFTLTCRFTLK